MAVFATLCCCVPFGIVAIVYAAQVDTKWSAGDHAGAVEASEKAKMWCWISVGVGLLLGLISFALQIAVAAAGNV